MVDPGPTHLLRDPAIRFLIVVGVLLIATIAIGVALIISHHYRITALNNSEREALYRTDGTVLARYPNKKAATGEVFQPVIDLFKNSDDGTSHFESLFESERRERMAAHRVANYPLDVSAAIDVKSGLADWGPEKEILIASAILTALIISLILFLVMRRILAANSLSQSQLSSEKHRLSAAINNMSQGLIVFDASEQMTVCNSRFLEMYDLSAEVVKPGCTFREMVVHRRATGSFVGDVDEYCSARLTNQTQQGAYEFRFTSEQRRTIRIVSRPVSTGGWLTTHDDITDQIERELELEREIASRSKHTGNASSYTSQRQNLRMMRS